MKVYLDNAATTPIDKEVLKEMMPLLENNFGNPSSIHSFGRISRSIVEAARKNVSKHLRCSPGEFFLLLAELKLIIWLLGVEWLIWE